MNTEFYFGGTRIAHIYLPDSSVGATDAASGSGNERQTATAWYRTDRAKSIWRGLAVVSVGVALGAGGELLNNYLAYNRDGHLPSHTHDTPQPLAGAILGFLVGGIVAGLNEVRLGIQKASLEGRSISVASSHPDIFTAQDEIPVDRHPVGKVSRV
ncbi:hypothetical protein [Endozoicomonas sp. YOMI1]|uniref:hypothetical protein n=1 Tax=Endozoicomonas sp. YOMI1 TaxID=2828739 RepID=UPI002148D0EB|nr:hypothetical protein [Endozoicomonas sp. YOMI1]